jgi:uncharacterized protein
MTVTRRAVLKTLIAAGAGAVVGPAAYGYLYGRHQLGVTRVTLPVAGLPPALAGVRLGLITDIHRSRWVSHQDVADVVEMMSRERPDLVVLGGDYVTWGDRQFVGPSADALAPLTAPHGVFAILGNHDDDHDMAAALGRNGIQVLKDARTRVTLRHEPLDLVGIRFWTKRQRDIADLVRDSAPATVLIAHDPRRITEAAALNVPLVLSGHTHGGQVVLPGVGALAARKFPIAEGVLRRDRTTMFVSRGVGTIYVPVRINCAPEVAVLTLQPA